MKKVALDFEFSAVLAKQSEGTVGFFVTNTTYSSNAINEASNSKQQIIFCSKENVVEKVKSTKLQLENKELKKISFELDDVIIENLEIDSEDTTVYLFGIKIEGNCKIGALRIKHSAIGVEKSTFEEKFKSYLEEKRYRVYRPLEASLFLEDELKLFCKDPKNNALFFQYAILNFYKKQTAELNVISSYDFIILDQTYIDTEVFTLMNTQNKEIIEFLKKKRQEIKIENINKVIYLKPSDENMIQRQRKRDREAETYSNEYLIELSNFYEKLIDKIYPSHVKFENNCSVEEYEKNYFEKLLTDIIN
ncbi:8066_t:CDS:2 [Racocetra fulgida]|uniref:8066_t:CDS:1 n=1 Tax=Racocetra fulgida TaxID=60492 RepID=A0A9N9AYI9_9GLOM|nr:8066_t:CDS:2 [Racocetra fulgida]